MKLAFLMHFAPRKLGSLEAWLLAFARAARRRGHQVDLFGTEPTHPAFLAELRGLHAGWHDVRQLERNFWPGVRTLSTYDVLNLNMVEVRKRLALMTYAAWPARVVWVDHASGYLPPEGSNTRSPRDTLRPARWLLDQLSTLRLDKVVGVSNYVRDRDQQRFGLPPGKAVTIYNGVDVTRFRAAPKRANPDRVTVTTVAHLMWQKGVHHLLGALHQLRDPRIRLRIVGDGPELGNLKAQARALRLDAQVDFLGLRDDVNELVRETDLFVHPALWPEAFGLTIIEAMAAGRPVIASRVGGIPEIIEHGRSGMLVPPGDEGALARAIRFLATHADERMRLGAAGGRKVEQSFTLERCVAEHLRLCEALVPGAVRPPVAARPTTRTWSAGPSYDVVRRHDLPPMRPGAAHEPPAADPGAR